MTIAEYCILGAVLLCLLTIAPFKAIGFRVFDNSKPRDPDFYSEPLRARALGAHHNGIETFPFFAVAVLMVVALGRTNAHTALGAQLYLWGRVAYVPLYAAGLPWVRTVAWAVSLAGILLILLPLF